MWSADRVTEYATVYAPDPRAGLRVCPAQPVKTSAVSTKQRASVGTGFMVRPMLSQTMRGFNCHDLALASRPQSRERRYSLRMAFGIPPITSPVASGRRMGFQKVTCGNDSQSRL